MMLWVFVSLSDDYSTTFKLPVIINNIPEGYALKELSNPYVVVTLKGQGWQLAQLSFGVDHDLSVKCEDNKQLRKVSVRNALEQNDWLTSTLQVTLVSPEQIEYRLEKTSSKKVPIVEDLLLNYNSGYGLVSDIEVFPDSVTIYGPKSLVKGIDEVKSVRTEFVGLDKSVNQVVMLQGIEHIKYNRAEAVIRFEVQKIVDKVFENVKVIRKNVPPSRDLSLFPENINLVLRGGINHLAGLTNNDIKAHVRFRQALEDTLGSIEPVIEIPPFTTLIDVKPNRLEYIIKQY